MKYQILCCLLLFYGLAVKAQNLSKQAILDSTCTCIGNAIDNEVNTKFDFEYDFDICMDSLVSRLTEYDQKYSEINEVNSFIHNELKENCNRYGEVDSIKHLYSSLAFKSIASNKDCEIMKNGVFMNYGDKDSIRIYMSKDEQVIEYSDGTYTKSKIVWVDECSYKVIRVKSTNPQASDIPKGHEMLVNIIYVKDEHVVFYEILLNGKAYSGRMIKVQN